MYVSRLLFHTIPGKAGEVEKELKKLREMVKAAGGDGARSCIPISLHSALLMRYLNRKLPIFKRSNGKFTS